MKAERTRSHTTRKNHFDKLKSQIFDHILTSFWDPNFKSQRAQCTSGLRWEEIAELLDESTQVSLRRRPITTFSTDALKKYGKLDIFLDWDHSYGDYNCLVAGLESVGRGDLLAKT